MPRIKNYSNPHSKLSIFNYAFCIPVSDGQNLLHDLSRSRGPTHRQIAEVIDARCLAREQVGWKLAVVQHRIANLRAEIIVESQSGEVLETEVAVRVDDGAGDPRPE